MGFPMKFSFAADFTSFSTIFLAHYVSTQLIFISFFCSTGLLKYNTGFVSSQIQFSNKKKRNPQRVDQKAQH